MAAAPRSGPAGRLAGAAAPAAATADAGNAGARWPRSIFFLSAAAIGLRLILFLGRGSYVAFDEGFYLLLGRSLWTGEGFSLVGLPHIALSPLFPAFAGGVGVLIHDWVWGGRIVAALASGLLVLPAWAVFRRLATRRIAFVAAALVAVMPSLAPFVAAYWVGADLWVGAGPLYHLLLFTGIAAWLEADERGGALRWAAVGSALGLAFLARPEAIITWGLLGLATLVLAARARSSRRLGGAVVMGVVFVVVCTPYWWYLHETTGEWMLTGRGIAPLSAAARAVSGEDRSGAAATIEHMLWSDDPTYQQHLYGLDASGVRLRSSYWGVYPPRGPAVASESAGAGKAPARPDTTAGALPAAPAAARAPAADHPSALALYFRALGIILPLLLWPFVILGLAEPRPPGVLRKELPVTLSLLGTSIAIAVLVAVDPRTQLFLVPLLAFYAARGFSLIEREVRQRTHGNALRPGFVELVLASVAIAWLLSINGWRLYMSLSVGSPHHVVGAQNRRVALEVDSLRNVRPGPLMSWHPALAVFADRDWRVLPYAPLPEIIRYARAAGASVIVLSAYYPPDLGVESLDTRYLILPVPPGAEEERRWRVEVAGGDSIARFGRLKPAAQGVRP